MHFSASFLLRILDAVPLSFTSWTASEGINQTFSLARTSTLTSASAPTSILSLSNISPRDAEPLPATTTGGQNLVITIDDPLLPSASHPSEIGGVRRDAASFLDLAESRYRIRRAIDRERARRAVANQARAAGRPVLAAVLAEEQRQFREARRRVVAHYPVHVPISLTASTSTSTSTSTSASAAALTPALTTLPNHVFHPREFHSLPTTTTAIVQPTSSTTTSTQRPRIPLPRGRIEVTMPGNNTAYLSPAEYRLHRWRMDRRRSWRGLATLLDVVEHAATVCGYSAGRLARVAAREEAASTSIPSLVPAPALPLYQHLLNLRDTSPLPTTSTAQPSSNPTTTTTTTTTPPRGRRPRQGLVEVTLPDGNTGLMTPAEYRAYRRRATGRELAGGMRALLDATRHAVGAVFRGSGTNRLDWAAAREEAARARAQEAELELEMANLSLEKRADEEEWDDVDLGGPLMNTTTTITNATTTIPGPSHSDTVQIGGVELTQLEAIKRLREAYARGWRRE